MIILCTRCQARFRVADERIGPRGAKVRCSKCGNVFAVHRPAGVARAGATAPARPVPAPRERAPAPAPARDAAAASRTVEIELEARTESHPRAAVASAAPPIPPPAPAVVDDPFASMRTAAQPVDPFAMAAPTADPFAASAAADPFAPRPLPSDDPFAPVAAPFAPPAPASEPEPVPAAPAPAAAPSPFGEAGLGDPFVAAVVPRDAGRSPGPMPDLGDLLGASAAAAPAVEPPPPAELGLDLDRGGAAPSFAGGLSLEPAGGAGGLALDAGAAGLAPASGGGFPFEPPVPAARGFGADAPGATGFGGSGLELDTGVPSGLELDAPSPAGVAAPDATLAFDGALPALHPAGGTPPPSPVPPRAEPPAPPARPPAPAEPRAAEASPSPVRPARLRAVAVNAISLAALLVVALAIVVMWRGGGVGAALRSTSLLDAIRGAPAAAAPFAPLEVSSGLYDRADGPPLLYVKGRIVSHAGAPVPGVRVQVEIVRRGAVVARGEALAGALPSPEDLYAVGDAADLARRAAEWARRAPAAVRPGEAVPFVVAIADAPADLGGAIVRVVAAPSGGASR